MRKFLFSFLYLFIHKNKNSNDIWDSLDALDFFFEQVQQVFLLFSVYWIILNSLPPFRSIAAWKVFNSEFFWSVFYHIRTEYAGKYGPEKLRLLWKARTRKTPNSRSAYLRPCQTSMMTIFAKLSIINVGSKIAYCDLYGNFKLCLSLVNPSFWYHYFLFLTQYYN